MQRCRLVSARVGRGDELVRLGLDDEEDRPLLHLVAVLIIDFLQESLYPRDQIGGVYRRGIAGGLEIAGCGFVSARLAN